MDFHRFSGRTGRLPGSAGLQATGVVRRPGPGFGLFPWYYLVLLGIALIRARYCPADEINAARVWVWRLAGLRYLAVSPLGRSDWR